MSGNLGTLWAVTKGRRSRYGAAGVALLLNTGFMFARPLIFRSAIDYLIAGEELRAPQFVRDAVEFLGGRSLFAQNLWIVSIAVVLVTVFSGLFMYLRGRWAAQAAEAIAQDLRDRLYDHLQHLPCTYHDGTSTGDQVQRCSSDVETVRMFLSMRVVDIGRGIVYVAAALPILFWLDVRMALLSMLLLPVIFIFATVFFVKVQRTFKRSAEAEAKMTSLLQENITGIRVVRAFARQEHEIEKFSRGNTEYRDRWYRLVKVLGWYWPLSDVLCITQRGIVLISGAYFVMHGTLTIGTLYAFIACVGMFIWPFRQMGRVLADLGKALVSLGRVQEILAASVESDRPDAIVPDDEHRVRGEIVFENVSFSHGKETPVLDDVTLEVAPGQTLAILGPSGSGKTTLINLLLRLYDYEQGSIRLDGIELRDLPRKHVRSQMGVILQEPFLYSKSVRENIKLGRSSAGDEEMVDVAVAACIHDSIETFEHGYDTMVGERGVTLSGGQRQRVALARALLKDPPILVLDDALSSVDTQTETMILRALRERRGRHTTLVIAHRLTTLQHADSIIVIEDGRIVQRGTHASLLREDGMYRRLWSIQSSLEETVDQVNAENNPQSDEPAP